MSLARLDADTYNNHNCVSRANNTSIWRGSNAMHDLNVPNVIYHNFSSIRKEGRNFVFNDALNTFYLRLYGVGHMVKDHSDSERGNQLPPHRLLLPISSKGYFVCIIP